MKSLAVDSLATDSHPLFWEYAASLASRWADALAGDPLDWAVLGTLREEAKLESRRGGVWLAAFCGGVESTYVALRGSGSLDARQGGCRSW